MDEQPNILICHPTLDDVFTPATRRLVFKKRPDPNPEVIRKRLLVRLKEFRAEGPCCNKKCTLKAKGEFLAKIVRWRRA
jgi:hypothetical protein